MEPRQEAKIETTYIHRVGGKVAGFEGENRRHGVERRIARPETPNRSQGSKEQKSIDRLLHSQLLLSERIDFVHLQLFFIF